MKNYPYQRYAFTTMHFTLIFLTLLPFFGIAQSLPKREGSSELTPANLKALIEEGIDPRKYVTVLYKKVADAKPENTLAIWRWDSDLAQHQRFKVIDKEGFINIYFDKRKLAEDTKFKGNISLSATVKSKAGERAIEVSPYSRIGEQRKTFGTNSISPELTAQLLFNVVKSIKSALHSDQSTFLSGSFAPYVMTSDSAEFKAILNEIIDNKLEKVRYRDQRLDNLEVLDSLLIRYKDLANAQLIERNRRSVNYTYAGLSSDLIRFGKVVHDGHKLDEKGAVDKRLLQLDQAIKDMKLITKYLETFETAGPDAKTVFLRLIGKDIIKYEQLRKTLATNTEKLSSIIKDRSSLYQQILDGNVRAIISDTQNSLLEISSFSGSDFDKAIDELKKTAPAEISGRSKNILERSSQEYDRLKDLEVTGQYETVLRQLSKKAGEYLYALLTYASIDLAKNDVKQGDILYLNVQWKNFKDQMVDSLRIKDDEKMDIGTFKIEKTGWSTEVSESFYLIERINEPNRLSDDRISPSNFKGAAGVSLMRTYNYSEPGDKAENKFLNWLQPSVGLNLSYIDFYTTKDLELGLAFQTGIFKNSIFLGYGVNLNGIRGGEKNSTYFMLGLSFTNLAAKFKSSESN
jgi:hypothetical protein